MDMRNYLEKAVADGASDLFLVAGSPASYRIHGRLTHMDDKKLLPPDTDQGISALYQLAERDMTRYREVGDDDFSFALPGLARFRVNAYRQRGSLAAVIRLVSFHIPDWQAMRIPEAVMELANTSSGLIIVTGPAGSGKSTTQACIIDRINQTRDCHIVTLEDPIEFLHRNRHSIISQREIAIDTADCLAGLRACLRQAPDVILLGEMRDAETIRTAMTAAETGHTVITTLHTGGAADTIDRIIDAFPASQQNQVRVQLASVLHTVVAQQLIQGKNGKLAPAFEIMRTNTAIRNLIREGKTHQLTSAIASGAAEGMITMDQSLFNLYKSGIIEGDTALAYAGNPEQLGRRMG